MYNNELWQGQTEEENLRLSREGKLGACVGKASGSQRMEKQQPMRNWIPLKGL